MSKKPFVFEPFDLPVFDVPQREHWPAAMSWEQAMENFDAARKLHMLHFYSAEERLRSKNPEPFRLD